MSGSNFRYQDKEINNKIFINFVRDKPGPPRYAQSTTFAISSPNSTNLLLNVGKQALLSYLDGDDIAVDSLENVKMKENKSQFFLYGV